MSVSHAQRWSRDRAGDALLPYDQREETSLAPGRVAPKGYAGGGGRTHTGLAALQGSGVSKGNNTRDAARHSKFGPGRGI
jgi:hypothetical protein